VELAPVGEVRPGGPHNVANALAAAALARAHGVPAGAVLAGLRAFVPDRHRNAPVAVVAGVSYVDDSKATNPHAAAASLAGYPRVVWIAGGLLKGASVDELVATVAEAAGKRVQIRHVEGPVGVQSRNFSNDRIYSTGWRPQVSLREGIRETYRWVREQVLATSPVAV
jgi:nucleoside-diphosphate-sugar epimerase